MITRRDYTCRGGKRSISDKILKYLLAHPEGATPKMIAFATSININKVKYYLPKIPQIKRQTRGLYLAQSRGDTPPIAHGTFLEDWNFHNCILSVQLPGCFGGCWDWCGDGLVCFVIKVSVSGRASFRVGTDFPLNVASLYTLFCYFDSLIYLKYGFRLSPVSVMVRTIEFNKDYSNLRLDGLNSLSIDSLCEQFKVYQKGAGVRVERKTKVPFSVENVTDMLQNIGSSVDIDVKLGELKKEVSQLCMQNTQLVGLMKAIVKKGDGAK